MILSQRVGLKETFPFCIIHFPDEFSFVNNKHMLLLEPSKKKEGNLKEKKKKLKCP